MDYYTTTKRNKLLIYGITQMNLQNMLSLKIWQREGEERGKY